MSNTPTGQDLLRAEAEARLDSLLLTAMPAQSAEDLVRELHVSHFKLEMQSETLRQSQTVLEASRDRYVDFYELAPVGYLTLNHDGLIIEINLTGAALLGEERHKLLQHRFALFVAPEDRAGWHQHFMAVLQHDSKQVCELGVRRGDGANLHVQLDSLRLLREGDAPVVRISLSDITERRQLEEKLKKGEERWKFALEGAGDGVWDWNPQTDEVSFSRRWKEMIGYAEHEFSNSGSAWAEHLHPDDKDRALSAIQECFSGTRPIYAAEFRMRCKDGSWKWIQSRGKLINRDGDGNPLRMIGTHTDITERKLAEIALREIETELHLIEQREIVQTSLDGFWVVNAKDARILEANDAFCDMVGYSREELLTMSIADLEANEALEETDSHIKKIMEVGYDRFETCHRHKQGHLVNLEVSASHSEIDGGIIFVFVRDITERKLLEQQLRLKEFILEHARDAVFLCTHDKRFVYVNDEACRVLGYQREELLGLTAFDIDADIAPESAACRLEHVHDDGTFTFETHHRRSNGGTFPVEIRYSSFEYQGQTMKIVLARDITERKRAERKVAELQYRNELILNTAGDGICGIDENGLINFINPAAEIMLGYSADELYGSSLDVISRHAKLDGRACPNKDCQMLDLICGGASCHKGEEVYRHKNGSTFPVSCTRAPIIDKGKCIGAVVMFRDITESKRSEQLVRELSVHLQNVREEEKANFAREIHDELGSTLSALKIEASRLSRGLSAEQKAMPLFARVESMVDLLDDAVAATRRIITDLRPTMLDDLGLLAALEWQAEQFHKRTGIECKVIGILDGTSKDELDKIWSINLFRIFQEALANVARHSGASKVEVKFQHGDEDVFLSISDNGRGLPREPFIASTSYGIRGMHERVEQMGGTIKFDTAPDSGLTVVIKLPLPAVRQKL